MNNKILYIKQNPNFDDKGIICETNTDKSLNDLFEVYSLKNILYLASPNIKEKKIDIFEIQPSSNFKLKLSIDNLENLITRIKYCKINSKNFLFTLDNSNHLKIWELKNNTVYEPVNLIKNQNDEKVNNLCIIDTTSINYLLLLDKETANKCLKVFNLNDGNLIKILTLTKSNLRTYYISYWVNKDDIYIIECCLYGVYIYNMNDEKLYAKINDYEYDIAYYYCEIIYNKNGEDLLCICDSEGFITLYDLFNKKIKNKFRVDKPSYSLNVWNEKKIIIAAKNKIRVIDIDENKIISSFNTNEKVVVKCIKKAILNEKENLLFFAGNDGKIFIWETK